MEWVPTLLVNDEKLKVLTNMAIAFNSFFITVTEKFNIHYIEKGAIISLLIDSLPGNFPGIKINPITQAGIKSIIHSLKKPSGYDEITIKIFKKLVRLSLVNH